jgi:NTP pyrophosphatase (non-canonical NTP hydrolase)
MAFRDRGRSSGHRDTRTVRHAPSLLRVRESLGDQMTDRELEKAQMFASSYGMDAGKGKVVAAYTMSAGLLLLAQSQAALWRRDRGESFTGTAEEVRTIAFALIAETLEVSDELGWKSWKPTKKLTPEDKMRVVAEFADVMAFFGTYAALIINRLDVFPEDLVRAYLEKVEENYRRFNERDAGQV